MCIITTHRAYEDLNPARSELLHRVHRKHDFTCLAIDDWFMSDFPSEFIGSIPYLYSHIHDFNNTRRVCTLLLQHSLISIMSFYYEPIYVCILMYLYVFNRHQF